MLATRTWFYLIFIMAMLGVGIYVATHRWSGGQADVHYQNGFNLAAEGKHHEAIVELKKALSKDPMHELARAKLAEEYEAIGNYGDALAQWERLLRETENEQRSGQKRPRVTKPWYVKHHIGICKLKMGRYSEAVDAFHQALESSPAAGEVHRLTGEALARLGKTREAAREFLEAIRRKPEDTEAYRLLMKLYKDKGLDDKARELGERMKGAGSKVANEWETLKRRYGW
jgi:tetratricopeptide (TPR) repeat protein